MKSKELKSKKDDNHIPKRYNSRNIYKPKLISKKR